MTLANNDQTELILSTIAVVFSPDPRPARIGSQAIEAILRRPLAISQSPEGPIITSNRDQVEVQFFLNKIDVRESSGDVAQAKSKIPRIMHAFLAPLDGVSIRSYGINFISEINVERPREWLGNNLLNPSLASELGTPFSSNLVTLLLDQPPKAWTVRFEAQPDNRLSVSFNASENTDTLPNQQELASEIGQQYDAFTEFLSQMGL